MAIVLAEHSTMATTCSQARSGTRAAGCIVYGACKGGGTGESGVVRLRGGLPPAATAQLVMGTDVVHARISRLKGEGLTGPVDRPRFRRRPTYTAEQVARLWHRRSPNQRRWACPSPAGRSTDSPRTSTNTPRRPLGSPRQRRNPMLVGVVTSLCGAWIAQRPIGKVSAGL
jgi:hypothetical protein